MNLYGHEELVETYEKCLKTENERLDRTESERKTDRKLIPKKVEEVCVLFRSDEIPLEHPGFCKLGDLKDALIADA